MTTAPKAPMAHAPGGRKTGCQPGSREGKGDTAEGLQRAVTEQAGVLLDAGVNRREGGMGTEYIERCGLVELGDDEREERVHARQVDVGEEVPERSLGADEKDEQEPDHERRHHEREQDAKLDDAAPVAGGLGRAGRRAAYPAAPWRRGR